MKQLKGCDSITFIKELNNGKNWVFADDKNYYITTQKTEKYLTIDKDENTLNYIEMCIAKYGSLVDTSTTFGFSCQGRTDIRIAHLLIAYYEGVKYKKKTRVFYKDGNAYNCKRDNISRQNGKLKTYSRSVDITHDDDYIYLTSRKHGKVYVTYYEEDLFALLASSRISWTVRAMDKGNSIYYRLCAKITYHNKVCSDCYSSISEIVLGYYYYGVRANNLVSSLRKMKKEIRQQGIISEHLIADECNNTRANLSLVREKSNLHKRLIDGKVQPPYFLVMAYKDGVYKAVYALDCGIIFVEPVIEATDINVLVDKLIERMSSKVFGNCRSTFEWHKDRGGTKFNLLDNYKIQKYMYDNFDSKVLDQLVGQYIDVNYESLFC